MWINDVERERVGRDVKSGEFAFDCVVRGGAVTESERTTVVNICHPTIILRTKKRRGRKRRGKERARERAREKNRVQGR